MTALNKNDNLIIKTNKARRYLAKEMETIYLK